MDFVRDPCSPDVMAQELELSEAEVQAVLDSIVANHSEVEAEYERILQRVQQANPPHIQAGRAKTPEAFKARIRARHLKDVDHAPLGG